MKKETFPYIFSANSAIISILLVYLFTLASMPGEVTAQGQSGFIPTPPSNNNTNRTPFDDRCDPNKPLVPIDCPGGDQNTQQEGAIPGGALEPAPSGNVPYNNEALGVQFTYPQSWIVQEANNGSLSTITLIAPVAVAPANVQVGIFPINQTIATMPIEEIANRQIGFYSQGLTDFELVDSGPVSIQTQFVTPAYELQYTSLITVPGGRAFEIQSYEIFTISGNSMYTIIYNSEPSIYSTYFPSFQDIVESFQITR
jgi:hypothetical protein